MIIEGGHATVCNNMYIYVSIQALQDESPVWGVRSMQVVCLVTLQGPAPPLTAAGHRCHHLLIFSAAGLCCDTQSVAMLDCVPRVSVETIKHYTRQLDLSPGLQTPSYHPAGAWCQPSAQSHNIIVLESENGLAEMEISTFLAVIMDTYTTGF